MQSQILKSPLKPTRKRHSPASRSQFKNLRHDVLISSGSVRSVRAARQVQITSARTRPPPLFRERAKGFPASLRRRVELLLPLMVVSQTCNTITRVQFDILHPLTRLMGSNFMIPHRRVNVLCNISRLFPSQRGSKGRRWLYANESERPYPQHPIGVLHRTTLTRPATRLLFPNFVVVDPGI